MNNLSFWRSAAKKEFSIQGLGFRSGGNGAPSGRALPLSERRKIVVIADEAHLSQYDLIDGLARNLRDSLAPPVI